MGMIVLHLLTGKRSKMNIRGIDLSGVALTGFSYGNTESLGTLTTSNVTVVSNTVTQFGVSTNCYSFAGNTSSYVSYPGQSGFAVGTGDFTVEWFQYQTDTNNFPRIFWYGSSPSLGVSIELGTFYIWPSVIALKSGLSQKNAWHHFALVRISGRFYLYYDGVIQNAGGTAISINVTNTTSTFVIGAKIGGLVSENFGGLITSFRFCKGVGVYTGNFTVPSSKLAQTQSAGTNISAIAPGQCTVLLNP